MICKEDEGRLGPSGHALLIICLSMKVMSTEEADQSTALMDEMSSQRIEGCFNVALTGTSGLVQECDIGGGNDG